MSVSITFDGKEVGWCRGYDIAWELVDDLFTHYAWTEFYPHQKKRWLSCMSCPSHQGKRVWVHPFENVAELRYEYYMGDSYNLRSDSTFIVVTNFDGFIRDFLSRVNRRTSPSYSQ